MVRLIYLLATVWALSTILTGCANKPSESMPDDKATEGASAEKDLPEGLAELPAEERQLALTQKICPVSAHLLGSMGKPTKVTLKGKTVFLCCEGCEEDAKKDPDATLAKLPK